MDNTSQAVIKEAMRVHPSNCYPLERVVPNEGAMVCGHFLPGGTIVSMMAPVINRAKNVYGEDADDFRPERWLEADTETLKAMERTFFTAGLPPSRPLLFSWTNMVNTEEVTITDTFTNSLDTVPVPVSGRISP